MWLPDYNIIRPTCSVKSILPDCSDSHFIYILYRCLLPGFPTHPNYITTFWRFSSRLSLKKLLKFFYPPFSTAHKMRLLTLPFYCVTFSGISEQVTSGCREIAKKAYFSWCFYVILGALVIGWFNRTIPIISLKMPLGRSSFSDYAYGWRIFYGWLFSEVV